MQRVDRSATPASDSCGSFSAPREYLLGLAPSPVCPPVPPAPQHDQGDRVSWKGSLTTVSAGTLSLQGWDPGHLRDISVPALAVCSKDACRPGSLSFAGHRTSLVVPSLEQPSAVPENCGEDGQSFPCLVLGSSDVSAALLVGESTSFSTTHGRCRAVAACPVLSLARMMFLL